MDLAEIRKKALKGKQKSQGTGKRKRKSPEPKEPEREPEPDLAPTLAQATAGEKTSPPAESHASPEGPAAPAEKAAESVGSPDYVLVTFYLGKEGYAIPIDEIQEVLPPVKVTPIPRTSKKVSGLFTLRGIMVPLFDLRMMLELTQAEGEAGKFLVINRDDHVAALPIDRLGQVIAVRESGIKPPPPYLKGIRGEYLRGIVDIGGRVFGILNLQRILPAWGKGGERP